MAAYLTGYVSRVNEFQVGHRREQLIKHQHQPPTPVQIQVSLGGNAWQMSAFQSPYSQHAEGMCPDSTNTQSLWGLPEAVPPALGTTK